MTKYRYKKYKSADYEITIRDISEKELEEIIEKENPIEIPNDPEQIKAIVEDLFKKIE